MIFFESSKQELFAAFSFMFSNDLSKEGICLMKHYNSLQRKKHV